MRKRIISAALALCMALSLLPVNARAADIVSSGICGTADVTWTLDNEQVLTISGRGDMGDRNSVPSWFPPSDFTSAVIEEGVTSIGIMVFKECEDLTSVTIPSSVTSIRIQAFSKCRSLTSVTIPKGVTIIEMEAFSECRSLTSVTIPDSVISIGTNAFEGCESLTSVTIPGSIKSIMSKTFYMCKNLTNVTILDGPENIRSDAFTGCESLTSVTIPDSVIVIDGNAFDGCESLKNVYYGGSEEDWNKVTIRQPNEELTGAAIHYNSPIPPSFTVTFDSQGGSEVPAQASVVVGSKAAEPDAPTREGAVFKGWCKDLECTQPWDFGRDIVTENTTLYANWLLLPTYTVTFDSRGGSEVLSQAVVEGKNATRPDDPTRDGYHFDDWYKSLEYKESDRCSDFNSYAITADVTLYAKWFCTVTFNSQGGSEVGTQKVKEGGKATEPKNPTKDGYSFDGWYKDKGCTELWSFETDTVGKNTELYAKWLPLPTYTVTFNSQGGSEVGTQNVKEGGKATEPKKPTKDGYSFGGWYKDKGCTELWSFETDTVGKNTELYAKWLPPCTVTFDTQGGTPVAPQVVEYGGHATAPTKEEEPTKAKFHFGGWFKSLEYNESDRCNFSSYAITADVTLYAKWLPLYTVTYESNGGSAVNPDEVEEGKNAKQPANPARDGYRFIGWYQDPEWKTTWDFKTVVTKDLTLYAKWQKVYTVTYDYLDGRPVWQETVDSGSSPQEMKKQPSRDRHHFDGWFLDEKYTAECPSDYTVTSDVTLYAKWLPYYTITFDSNGGSPTRPQTRTTKKDGTLERQPEEPTLLSHKFDGWYTLQKEGDKVDLNDAYTFSADATLYAHWTLDAPAPDTPSGPRSYIITFDANGGGSNITMATSTDGRLSTLPNAPAYTGYTFDGWYTQREGGEKITTSTVFLGHTTVYAHWTASSGQPSTPSTPSDPSGAQYQIYTPNYTSGGSLYVSHDSAAEGTRVTIRLVPWSGYQLSRLSVTNYATGRQLSLTRVSATEYTFTMPAGSVSVSATFTGGSYTPAQTQTTSQAAGWYYRGGYIYHTTSGLIPASSPLNRDMLISVLYNMDGSSHDEPAIWAVSNGIVPDVYSSLLWGADKSITREQMAAILYCYAGYKGYSTSQRASLVGYTDYSQIRAAAQTAMSWAQAAGLITGTSATTLSPQAVLTCEQANTILLRFITSVAQGR